MSNSPNKQIPYVPEGTLDPAAGLNDAIDVLDAIDSVVGVLSIGLTEPPTASDGDLYIVGEDATGDWTGLDNRLVRYVADGDFWRSFLPGAQVTLVYNREDGLLYRFDEVNSPSGWIIAAGIGDAPSDGTRYARKDAGWESFAFPVRAERVTWISPIDGVALDDSVNYVDLVIPYDGTIIGMRVTSKDGPGTAVIDIQKKAFGSWPPDGTNSILDTSKITITAADTFSTDTPLSDGFEDIDVEANDVLRFVLDSTDTFTGLFVTLLIQPL
jgi:hypothetical protein